MSLLSRLLWITGALSVALFVCLGVMSVGWLEASGLSIFDGRIAGYSVTAARAYLKAVSEAQTALYLGWFHWLDTALPILLSITLAGVIWLQGLRGVLRVLTSLTPCVYLFMDLSENAAVAAMLQAGAQASDALILQASSYTVSKWISLTLAILLAVWAWRVLPRSAEDAS